MLKNLRQKAGITQRDLGPFIGRTHSYIGKVERGTQHIDFATLLDYIYAVGADPKEVLVDVCDAMPKSQRLKKS